MSRTLLILGLLVLSHIGEVIIAAIPLISLSVPRVRPQIRIMDVGPLAPMSIRPASIASFITAGPAVVA